MKTLVEHLKQWTEDSNIAELSTKTHARYQGLAKNKAKEHDAVGMHKINAADDEDAGIADFEKRDRRENGIKRSRKLDKKQHPVAVVKDPDGMIQRIKKLAGV